MFNGKMHLTALRRIGAGVMLATILAASAFSLILVAIEARHDCSGLDCHSCATIGMCAGVLESFGNGFAVAAAAAAALRQSP